MKNQEIQYLQQNKRKATKPRDKGKPDWWEKLKVKSFKLKSGKLKVESLKWKV
jgi:hypothetical protein